MELVSQLYAKWESLPRNYRVIDALVTRCGNFVLQITRYDDRNDEETLGLATALYGESFYAILHFR